jgi:hypothetical protein
LAPLRYVRLGTLGYGLQIAAYLVYAVVTAFLFTNAFNLRGLNILGLLTPIPGLLIGLTWVYAGKDRKVSLFTATGIIGLIIFGLGLTSTLVTWILVPQNNVLPLNPSTSTQLIPIFFEVAAFAAVVGLLAITHFILETISFFSAGKNFQERMFRLAGWSRIFAIVAAGILFVVIVFLGIMSALSSITGGGPPGNLVALQVSPGPGSQFANLLGLALGGIYAIFTVPEAFAFLGFRRLNASMAAGHLPPTTTAPSTAPQPSIRFCPNCGTATIAGSRFCSNCGNPLL